jgi:hypothetical protein
LSFESIPDWPAISLHSKIVALAAVTVLVEIAARRWAPKSRAYAAWTRFFAAVGSVWTAVLLALIYFVSVGPTGLVMRFARRDSLDRTLRAEPSFWRAHAPNPLGAAAASRHQF